MQAHRRLLLLDSRLRELSHVPKAQNRNCRSPLVALIQAMTLKSVRRPGPGPPTPDAHRYGAPNRRTIWAINRRTIWDITRHWPPAYHWYPVTPVTVPVIQTSSAQLASPLARRKGTIADSIDLQSEASRWAEALRQVRVDGKSLQLISRYSN